MSFSDYKISNISKSSSISLYELHNNTSSNTNNNLLTTYISSSPESQKICNDPLVCGVKYTNLLKKACENTFKSLNNNGLINLSESKTCVLNILRGGLNFGLREALADAFNWNYHSSAFISAQRTRKAEDPDQWLITENNYQKVYLPTNPSIIFGDVVATGTSLKYAIDQIIEISEKQELDIERLVFFTIGGKSAETILNETSIKCKELFPSFKGIHLIFLEGCFSIANDQSPLSVYISGTDLLRRDSILAPEFIESQFENPTYPIERCAIYDAGSRAFYIKEYISDVADYWKQTLSLAEKGMSYDSLLMERFPEISPCKTPVPELKEICLEQIKKCEDILNK